MQVGTPPKTAKKSQSKAHFTMFTVNVFYERDEAMKERPMNILLETKGMIVNKPTLAQVQQSAIARIQEENAVEVSDVKDIVVMNIAHLGHMTEEQFHGKT